MLSRGTLKALKALFAMMALRTTAMTDRPTSEASTVFIVFVQNRVAISTVHNRDVTMEVM